jgi:hypothetical protein
VLTTINNCLDNSVISHVYSKLTSNEAWLELIQIFESKNEVTKMFLKDKLQTLKMKEGENVTKHIHKFGSVLQQLTATGAIVQGNEAILSLMRSTSVNPVPNAQVCYFNNVWFMF